MLSSYKNTSVKKLFLFFYYYIRIFLIHHINLHKLMLTFMLKRVGLKHDIRRPVLLYGLQRSGTNLVNSILFDHGVNVINFSEYPPWSKWNRHFRFRSDSIPTKAVTSYFPRQEVLVDEAILPDCFIDNNFDYFILVREFDQWIISIMKWGQKNRWYNNGSSKQKVINALATDYIRYLETWIAIKQSRNNINIVFIPFDDQSWSGKIGEILDMNLDQSDYVEKKFRGSYDYKSSQHKESDFLSDCSIDSVLHSRALGLYNDIVTLT